MTVHVTVPVDEAEKAELENLAQARGLGLEDLVAEAVSAYVRTERALLAAIDEGLASLDAGEGIPHEQVVADAMRRRAERNRAA